MDWLSERKALEWEHTHLFEESDFLTLIAACTLLVLVIFCVFLCDVYPPSPYPTLV